MLKQWSKRVLFSWINVFCSLLPQPSEIEAIMSRMAEVGQPVSVREAAAYLMGVVAEKKAVAQDYLTD
jgi:hypothetical protein